MSRSSFAAFGLSMKDHKEILVAAAEAAAAEDDDDFEAEDVEAEEEPSFSFSPQASSSGLLGRMFGLKSDGGGDMYYNLNRSMKWYVQWLDSNPLFSRCVTSGVIGCVGAILTSRKPVITSNNIHRRRYHGPNSSNSNKIPIKMGIDWLEVLAFGLHGALVSGPLSYRIDTFLENNFYDSQSSLVLFDQAVATPVQLFIMFAFLDSIKAVLRELPDSVARSWSALGGNVSESMMVWPVSIYVLLKILKKRRHYLAAINLCSIAWVARLAKKRREQHQ
mmetsp:Transcript_18145/g.43881  ORF Transcript_18145/g.43881 Transcript_18145/m.43881 type:complete len:277 (+) Transcript_18145:34-864(+)